MSHGVIYADVIGHIGVENGMVRLDLFTELPIEGQTTENMQTGFVHTNRIVIPLVGFAQSIPALETIIKEMEKQGAIVRTPAPESGKT